MGLHVVQLPLQHGVLDFVILGPSLSEKYAC
jgi:hypothetical protein